MWKTLQHRASTVPRRAVSALQHESDSSRHWHRLTCYDFQRINEEHEHEEIWMRWRNLNEMKNMNRFNWNTRKRCFFSQCSIVVGCVCQGISAPEVWMEPSVLATPLKHLVHWVTFDAWNQWRWALSLPFLLGISVPRRTVTYMGTDWNRNECIGHQTSTMPSWSITKELLGFRRKPMSVEPLIVIESFWTVHRHIAISKRQNLRLKNTQSDFFCLKLLCIFTSVCFFLGTTLHRTLHRDLCTLAAWRSTTISPSVVLWNSHGLDLHHNGFE